MKPENLKPMGIACFVVCLICLFIAVERYQANAANVTAMRTITQSMPFGGASPLGNLQPATPAATKYAVFFAILSGVAGVFCFRAAGRRSI